MKKITLFILLALTACAQATSLPIAMPLTPQDFVAKINKLNAQSDSPKGTAQERNLP